MTNTNDNKETAQLLKLLYSDFLVSYKTNLFQRLGSNNAAFFHLLKEMVKDFEKGDNLRDPILLLFLSKFLVEYLDKIISKLSEQIHSIPGSKEELEIMIKELKKNIN